jgi:hypothetical protein
MNSLSRRHFLGASAAAEVDDRLRLCPYNFVVAGPFAA